jgi:hypothetical protein
VRRVYIDDELQRSYEALRKAAKKEGLIGKDLFKYDIEEEEDGR